MPRMPRCSGHRLGARAEHLGRGAGLLGGREPEGGPSAFVISAGPVDVQHPRRTSDQEGCCPRLDPPRKRDESGRVLWAVCRGGATEQVKSAGARTGAVNIPPANECDGPGGGWSFCRNLAAGRVGRGYIEGELQ
jgi:hypothetical protein